MDHGARRVRLAGLAVTLAATSALFALVAMNIGEGSPLALLDARVANWLHVHAFPALTYALLVVTRLHAPVAVTLYALAAAVVFWRRRAWSWLVTIVMAVPIGLGMNALIKQIFQRARPNLSDPLLTLSTFSFPSGHTAGAVLFHGVVAAYLMSRARSWHARMACVLLWVVLVILVGFSRMYLGVHYLSDILGAAAWAFAWLALSLWGAPHLVALRARTGS